MQQQWIIFNGNNGRRNLSNAPLAHQILVIVVDIRRIPQSTPLLKRSIQYLLQGPNFQKEFSVKCLPNVENEMTLNLSSSLPGSPKGPSDQIQLVGHYFSCGDRHKRPEIDSCVNRNAVVSAQRERAWKKLSILLKFTATTGPLL